jgi:hypothetical protein
LAARPGKMTSRITYFTIAPVKLRNKLNTAYKRLPFYLDWKAI